MRQLAIITKSSGSAEIALSGANYRADFLAAFNSGKYESVELVELKRRKFLRAPLGAEVKPQVEVKPKAAGKSKK